MSKVKLKKHEHMLTRVKKGRGGLECDACDHSFHEGYSCDECKFTIHQKCTFLFETQQAFKHPSHLGPGHCLKLLTTGAPDHTDPKCHICRKNTKRLLYHCSTCKVNMYMNCMVDSMCSQADQSVWWHPHPLAIVGFGSYMRCDRCGQFVGDGYFCPPCRLMVHIRCVSVFDIPEITHSCHVKHSLKLLTSGAPGYTDPECHLCGKDIWHLLYHCNICKFNLDLDCAIDNPPPVALSNQKVHEQLTLMPRLISFTCDACGMKGDRSPYVCHQCDLMIHQMCAHLPRVIYVNRHDHRVSYTNPLGPGEWICGVCWEEIDWSCGAYSCSTCRNYAVHSRCATKDGVWDKEELDGVPEEVEDIKPFKVNDDNTISHFAHKHNMSLNKDGIAFEESILCGACVRPIASTTFYSCSYCSFVIHETCANLSKKKRHFLSPTPLALNHSSRRSIDLRQCSACLQYCCKGFTYDDHARRIDLLCFSITEPFIHGCHPHPLLYMDKYSSQKMTCSGCGQGCNWNRLIGKEVLGCIKCNFFLDFRCATLPLTVKLPRYDDHPLTLCCGEKASGNYMCDICERETNSETWFYTCVYCGVTLHVSCVLGDLRYAKAGVEIRERTILLPNTSSSRPVCNNCHCHCPGPIILKEYEKNNFLCSFYCLISFFGSWTIDFGDLICPPWVDKAHT